jgi:endonuclease I
MVVEDGAINTQGDGMDLQCWTGGKIGNCMLRVSYRMQHENDIFIHQAAGCSRQARSRMEFTRDYLGGQQYNRCANRAAK